jgi:hypothetical protein
MTTLNGGFSTSRGDALPPEDRALINEFIRTKGVHTIEPAGADANEAASGSRERLAQARSDFRNTQKNKNK